VDEEIELLDEPYPMRYEVAYPPSLSRWKTLLRLPLMLPVMLFLYALASLLWAGVFVGWIAVFLTRSYPAWLFGGLQGALGFVARAQAYAVLQTDRYPAFDPARTPVLLSYEQPYPKTLSRWRVLLWKLAVIAPHIVVLAFLSVAVAVVLVVAWFSIVFTGRYPAGLFGFVTGVHRWWYRLVGYFASFTDRAPPFALSASAGPASGGSVALAAVLGLIIVGGLTGGVAAVAVLAGGTETVTVDYDVLQQGRARDAVSFILGSRDDPRFVITLQKATDNDTSFSNAFDTPSERRIVVFDMVYDNRRGTSYDIRQGQFTLVYRAGRDTHTAEAAVLLVRGEPGTAAVAASEAAGIRLAFSLPQGATPVRLVVEPPWASLKDLAFVFR
jgi:hypothetical protein